MAFWSHEVGDEEAALEAKSVIQVVKHGNIQQDSSMDVGNVRISGLGYLSIAIYRIGFGRNVTCSKGHVEVYLRFDKVCLRCLADAA